VIPSGLGLSAEVIDDESELQGLREEWDRLAVACARPYSSPAWMLAWWRHARPAHARLRAVVARDDGRLVAIAPLWLDGRELRVLGAGLSSPATPLAEPGREDEAAAAIGTALAGAGAAIVRLDGQERPGWGEVLAAAWPGRRPWVHSAPPIPCPKLSLDGRDYDGWLASKSSNFRSQARRGRRKLEEAGGRFTVAAAGDVGRACAAFASLHGARWETRGGSTALVAGLDTMLEEVARELVPAGRFRAVMLEAEGEIVSVQLFLAAGGTACYWNGGFDERWHRFAPAFQTLLFAVSDAIERGDTSVDLGPGDQPYKARLADSHGVLGAVTLVPRAAGYAAARARLLPRQLRCEVARRLSPETKTRLRRLLRGR
jgi:CelD/BcsL family acetyltransferase involved in cellulose biosynthesis